MNRREFLGSAAMAVAGMAAERALGAEPPSEMRAMLLHLGTHMWWRNVQKRPDLDFDYPTWETLTTRLAERKMNAVLIDIGEGLIWPSHPEIGIRGAWTVERLRQELARLRSLGLEPLPKLNFSTTHNFWLGEYRRMCATGKYHQVCDDLVRDCAEIFDHPRFMHIGFDEENANAQASVDLCVARKGELWYHDLFEHVRSVEKAGMRAWMWSDWGWHHEEFAKRCPKSVLQSNWYYDEDLQGFDPRQANEEFAARLNLFLSLDKAGFEQVPCGSNWKSAIQKGSNVKVNRSMVELVRFCRENLDPRLLKGFLMSSWAMSTKDGCPQGKESIDVFAEAVACR